MFLLFSTQDKQNAQTEAGHEDPIRVGKSYAPLGKSSWEASSSTSPTCVGAVPPPAAMARTCVAKRLETTAAEFKTSGGRDPGLRVTSAGSTSSVKHPLGTLLLDASIEVTPFPNNQHRIVSLHCLLLLLRILPLRPSDLAHCCPLMVNKR